jgi:hypothetical protein
LNSALTGRSAASVNLTVELLTPAPDGGAPGGCVWPTQQAGRHQDASVVFQPVQDCGLGGPGISAGKRNVAAFSGQRQRGLEPPYTLAPVTMAT